MKSSLNDADFKPMSLMSLLLSFISLIIVFQLLFTQLPVETRRTLVGIDTAICLLFLMQIAIDFYRSEHRLLYLRTRWLDILASIPFIEILRLARIVQIVRMLLLLIRHGHNFLKQVKQNRREATLATIFTLLILLVTTGSTFMLWFEDDAANSNIHNATDALWWSLVTISTVGYGDHYPVTLGGKVLATAMIICGVGIFGMISGLITSILTSPHHNNDHTNDQSQNDALEQLLQQQQVMLSKIELLEQQLKKQNT
ncbi:potassium channel family protein [Vibrio gangliei]|uniref:potassium channel family protein n=1 Tax=Vibrio gangliei TaxID=2077090 RepID=UPI000D01B05C|nr:potassium channel family protein [Vibrio gangliei]